jgi:hypothetical protein
MADPVTEELRAVQARKKRVEDAQAECAENEDEARSHRRRADKAAYLESKLAEQKRSQDER